MKQISTLSLNNLLVTTHYEYHQNVLDLIRETTPDALHIGAYVGHYEAAVAREMEIINRNRHLAKNRLLKELDTERDALLSCLYTQVDMATRSPILAEKQAGQALYIIISPYRDIPRRDYTKQTAGIDGLLRDLNTGGAVNHLDTLGASIVVQKLRQANNTFSNAMDVRIPTESARINTTLTTEQQRRIVDTKYKNLRIIINSFAVAAPATTFDTFIDKMNALIEQYKRVIIHNKTLSLL